ncbi:nuclease Le3 [Lentinula boryana]|uniref:Nuclease Le3 n=1 Tax=Lentinula boryana TaxID=40481 RepID=A0ABQ8QAN8_9AGAR|nr:nuclease Le3 [Lentinula boryana]
MKFSLDLVHGRGMKGHEAFLAPEASEFVQTSLSCPFVAWTCRPCELPAAVISDVNSAWPVPLHFQSLRAHLPNVSVNPKRDCTGDGCILTAIANYTSRVEALRFIGDIGQPLHVKDIDRKGSGIHVKCAGRKSNLHSFSADDRIINKLLYDEYDSSVIQWVNALTKRIQSFVWTYDSYEDLCSEDNDTLAPCLSSNCRSRLAA